MKTHKVWRHDIGKSQDMVPAEVAQGLYEALKEVRDTIQALIDGGYYGYVDQRRRIDIALAAADGEVE